MQRDHLHAVGSLHVAPVKIVDLDDPNTIDFANVGAGKLRELLKPTTGVGTELHQPRHVSVLAVLFNGVRQELVAFLACERAALDRFWARVFRRT